MDFIKKLFITIAILVILIVGGIAFFGYKMYSDAISKNAIISVEDHRFRTHNGIDIITTTRSMIENVRQKDIVAGR